jgi:hypothetical protein
VREFGVRARVILLALALTLTQAPGVDANKVNKSSNPAIGPTGGYVYRYVANKQQRKDVNNKWQSIDSRKEGSFDSIRVSAYKSINSLSADPNLSNINLEFLVRPGYPKQIEQVVRLQVEKIASHFSPLLSRPETAKIIMITEKDKSWVRSELPNIVSPEFFGGSIEILDWYNTKERFYYRGGTGGGIAYYIADKGYAFYISHTSSLATLETFWPEVPPHEFAHVLQGFLTNGFMDRYPNGHPESNWNGHFVEGSANTLGMALGFEKLGWYSDEMDKLLKQEIQRSKSLPRMNNLQDSVALIKAIEERNSENTSQFVYSAGQFVWEYFIGKYGVEKYVELLRNMPKSNNFNENLKVTIGKDKQAFYQEAGAYLLKNWKRISK